MEIIRSENLTFEYIRRDEEGNVESINRAIDHVNIEVQKGDFVAILGHNGSGKSTIATVVEEDVGFGPENLGVPTDDIWKRVEESLNAVGMIEYRTHSPNKLSGGQKQRVAIAGIMAMKPECIVLDEPTAMLDPNGRKEVIRTIKELNEKEKVTVILITHYMEEVISANKVFVMDEGKIVMEGTPKEIFSKVDLLKKYRLDVPQVTELAFELKKSGLSIPEGILSVKDLVDAICKL